MIPYITYKSQKKAYDKLVKRAAEKFTKKSKTPIFSNKPEITSEDDRREYTAHIDAILLEMKSAWDEYTALLSIFSRDQPLSTRLERLASANLLLTTLKERAEFLLKRQVGSEVKDSDLKLANDFIKIIDNKIKEFDFSYRNVFEKYEIQNYFDAIYDQTIRDNILDKKEKDEADHLKKAVVDFPAVKRLLSRGLSISSTSLLHSFGDLIKLTDKNRIHIKTDINRNIANTAKPFVEEFSLKCPFLMNKMFEADIEAQEEVFTDVINHLIASNRLNELTILISRSEVTPILHKYLINLLENYEANEGKIKILAPTLAGADIILDYVENNLSDDNDRAHRILSQLSSSFEEISGPAYKHLPLVSDFERRADAMLNEPNHDFYNENLLYHPAMSARLPKTKSNPSYIQARVSKAMVRLIYKEDKNRIVDYETEFLTKTIVELKALESYLLSLFTPEDFFQDDAKKMEQRRTNRKDGSAWVWNQEITQRLNWFVQLSIANCPDINIRNTRITEWILIANELIHSRYYSFAMQIKAALDTTAIRRVISSAGLPSSILSIFDEVNTFFSTDGNHRKYNQAIQAHIKAGVPFYPATNLLASQLTFGGEANMAGSPLKTSVAFNAGLQTIWGINDDLPDSMHDLIELADPQNHPLDSKTSETDMAYLRRFYQPFGENTAEAQDKNYSIRNMIVQLPHIIGVAPKSEIISARDLGDFAAKYAKRSDTPEIISEYIKDRTKALDEQVKNGFAKMDPAVSSLLNQMATEVRSRIAHPLTPLDMAEEAEWAQEEFTLAANIRYREDLLVYAKDYNPKTGDSEDKKIQIAEKKSKLYAILTRKITVTTPDPISREDVVVERTNNPFVDVFFKKNKNDFVQGFISDYLEYMTIRYLGPNRDGLNLFEADIKDLFDNFFSRMGFDARVKGILNNFLYENPVFAENLFSTLQKEIDERSGSFNLAVDNLMSDFQRLDDDHDEYAKQKLQEMSFSSTEKNILKILFLVDPTFEKYFELVTDPNAAKKWIRDKETVPEAEPVSEPILEPAAVDVDDEPIPARDTDAEPTPEPAEAGVDAEPIPAAVPKTKAIVEPVQIVHLRNMVALDATKNDLFDAIDAIDAHVPSVNRLLAKGIAEWYASDDSELVPDLDDLALRSDVYDEGEIDISAASRSHLTAHVIDNALAIQAALSDPTANAEIIQKTLANTTAILNRISPNTEAQILLDPLVERMKKFDEFNPSNVVFLTSFITTFETLFYYTPSLRNIGKTSGVPISFRGFFKTNGILLAPEANPIIEADSFNHCDSINMALIKATALFYNSNDRDKQDNLNQLQVVDNILMASLGSLHKFITNTHPGGVYNDLADKVPAAKQDLIQVIMHLAMLYRFNASILGNLKADMTNFMTIFPDKQKQAHAFLTSHEPLTFNAIHAFLISADQVLFTDADLRVAAGVEPLHHSAETCLHQALKEQALSLVPPHLPGHILT